MPCPLPVLLRLLAVLAMVLGLARGAWAEDLQPVPPLASHVTDTVGLLTPAQRDMLQQRLAGLARDKGAQVAVLVVATTRPEPIEVFAMRVAESWRLGRAGVDDGLIFLVARDDRRLRIEVGRGLEGVVPDAVAKRIIAEVVAPRFKAGDFPGGIEAGVDALIERVSAEALPPPVADAGSDGALSDIDLGGLLLVGVILVPLALTVLRALLGPFGGAGVAGALAGYGAWQLSGMVILGLVVGVVAFLVILGMGAGGGGGRRGGGGWSSGGDWGSLGGSSGGGGFSGGGGDFGGGGASGDW